MSGNRMTFRDAMELADAMDLPDGAFWAMSHELAGLEYGDGFDELMAGEVDRPDEEKRFSCQVEGCGKRFATKAAKRAHRRDRHGAA